MEKRKVMTKGQQKKAKRIRRKLEQAKMRKVINHKTMETVTVTNFHAIK